MFVGDPDGLLSEVAAELAPLRPKAVVLLGDYNLARPLHSEVAPLLAVGTQVWWIAGNDDTDHHLFCYRLFDYNQLFD
jgi:hypothetical protein